DPGAIAAALTRLVDDPERRASMGRAGREYVATHYDWQQNAAQMERVYASVLRTPAAAAT
ncbi:MAG TPA: glycosyltransferase, partial [Dehalococcoidia bacterium]|nr:glycosyltransferase [Dehalococcoidia bacterium]